MILVVFFLGSVIGRVIGNVIGNVISNDFLDRPQYFFLYCFTSYILYLH